MAFDDTTTNNNEEEILDLLDPDQLQELANKSQLVGLIREKFQKAKDAKRETEHIALHAYWSWRGEYSPEEMASINAMQARNPGSSKVFITVTKTKVNAAYSQIKKILFSEERFPIEVKNTPKPEGVSETVHLEPEEGADPSTQDIYGVPGDGDALQPGETTAGRFRGMVSKYGNLLTGKKINEGPSPNRASMPEINPAQQAALKLDKVMQDQLQESDAHIELSQVAFESVLYGTGIMKGPFSKFEFTDNWEIDPDTRERFYNPIEKLVPAFSYVSFWNAYPDPSSTTGRDIEWNIERHLLNGSALKDLRHQSGFDLDAILRILQNKPQHAPEHWEDSIVDNTSVDNLDRYEVLEYWGVLDKELAEAMGLEISVGDVLFDNVEVNAWISGSEILKVSINPFTPQSIPYYYVPYEEHPHQVWGTGISERMKDSQQLINGHNRMAIDNLRLSGNVMWEVNESTLSPGQDMTTYPGKIWRKNSGAPGQSIFAFTAPNTSTQHMQMVDKAMQMADLQTIPSFAHGQTGVSGTGRTASGISMLISAASEAIQTVVKNFDMYLLEPLGQSLFRWNMQFNDEDSLEIRGDYNILARGTSSLMQKEIKTQRLLQFLQVAANPALAPFVNMEYILKEIALGFDLDTDKAVNDATIARLHAEVLAASGPQQGAQQAPGLNPQDPTGAGGGVPGTGQVPTPGEGGFSGNEVAPETLG